ncbi:MAG TPA: hypothetical protein VFE34_20515 [Dongiaceae bacterium]|jgi:hypothetical protein|nr:hypothetical protein [Dongiaceae bacterium]
MSNFNVIELAPIRQRRTEQQFGQAARASQIAPWNNRYRDGIDGLVSLRRLRTSTGEVVPFVRRSRPHADACHELVPSTD